jgi:hypothetical protein
MENTMTTEVDSDPEEVIELDEFVAPGVVDAFVRLFRTICF